MKVKEKVISWFFRERERKSLVIEQENIPFIDISFLPERDRFIGMVDQECWGVSVMVICECYVNSTLSDMHINIYSSIFVI